MSCACRRREGPPVRVGAKCTVNHLQRCFICMPSYIRDIVESLFYEPGSWVSTHPKIEVKRWREVCAVSPADGEKDHPFMFADVLNPPNLSMDRWLIVRPLAFYTFIVSSRASSFFPSFLFSVFLFSLSYWSYMIFEIADFLSHILSTDPFYFSAMRVLLLRSY